MRLGFHCRLGQCVVAQPNCSAGSVHSNCCCVISEALNYSADSQYPTSSPATKNAKISLCSRFGQCWATERFELPGWNFRWLLQLTGCSLSSSCGQPGWINWQLSCFYHLRLSWTSKLRCPGLEFVDSLGAFFEWLQAVSFSLQARLRCCW
jgi:hypothetical protein